VDVLLHDQRAVLSICSRHREVAGVQDVTLSVPHLLGGNGVVETIPVPLVESEQAALHRSATALKQAIVPLMERQVGANCSTCASP
jgi:L-lactate dehydrogenase